MTNSKAETAAGAAAPGKKPFQLSKGLRYLFKGCVGVAFLLVLFSFVQKNEVVEVLGRIDWLYFSLSFLLVPVMLSTSCYKWRILLKVKDPTVSFRDLMRIYLVGYFFSNLLPSNVGGDVVRSFYSGQIIKDQVYSAVAVFLERFTGVLFLIMLVIGAPLFIPELYSSPYFYFPSLAAFILLIVILWVMTVKEPLKLPDAIAHAIFGGCRSVAEKTGLKILVWPVDFLQGVYENISGKVAKFHVELMRAMTIIVKEPVLLAKVAGVTAFFYMLTWLNVYVSFLAFGVDPGFFVVCALTPTIMFIGHLPVSILGNFGFFESVFVFYFSMMGIATVDSLAMGLLLRVKMLTLGGVGFIVYLLYKHRRAKELTELEEFARKKGDVS
ncbi:lysylphosphatidylglycerol synthase transmembrane domain-containing protein [Desulfopila sp. IMCC35008]|uniref:lysylphosphatidylglycerol synthase transmembrane domain-containing protein n=1 Tax=Desulfopila sp. IMCC35008 TaxID=2653858 RepID=UPI0013D3C626|nr:lysylphosphatidylglycerol synthase transmembrane domain-containing protein [Desulfopila sp. IMCC35008]